MRKIFFSLISFHSFVYLSISLSLLLNSIQTGCILRSIDIHHSIVEETTRRAIQAHNSISHIGIFRLSDEQFIGKNENKIVIVLVGAQRDRISREGILVGVELTYPVHRSYVRHVRLRITLSSFVVSRICYNR